MFVSTIKVVLIPHMKHRLLSVCENKTKHEIINKAKLIRYESHSLFLTKIIIAHKKERSRSLFFFEQTVLTDCQE